MKASNILIGLFCLIAASSANAITWTATGPDSAITTSFGTFTYSPNASDVWYAVLPDQGLSTVEGAVEELLGDVSLVSYCDGATCTGASSTGTGSTSASFTSDVAFNILAVHVGGPPGGNELLFKWAGSLTDFSIGSSKYGISNFRAYSDSTVPLPAAAWLFGSVLFGFMGWSNRRKV